MYALKLQCHARLPAAGIHGDGHILSSSATVTPKDHAFSPKWPCHSACYGNRLETEQEWTNSVSECLKRKYFVPIGTKFLSHTC